MLKKKRSLSNDLMVKQMGEILKVGYLKKKGHVRRNWLDRWFVLTSEGIYYYKTKEVRSCSMLKNKNENLRSMFVQ